MDGIMNNMMHNVHDASVRELQADDMVQGLDSTTMNQLLRDSFPTPTLADPDKTTAITIDGEPATSYGTTVGDLTIEQLLKYTAGILNVFNTLTSTPPTP